MGKTSRAIFAGVGAGLTQFGQQYGAKIAQDKADARVDARLEKEDAFKDRQLDIQEKDAELRQKAMERQGLFDEARLMHSRVIRGLNEAGGNLKKVGDVYTEHLPDGKRWHFNDAETKKRGAYAVFNIGHRVKDPGTGEYLIDETTGLPMEKASPVNGGYQVFQDEKDYISWRSNVINPLWGLAQLTMGMDDARALKNAQAVAKWKAGTEEGIAALAATKAKTGLDISKAGQADRSPVTGASADKVDRITGLDGEEVELTVTQSQRLQKDTLAMSKLYEGISSGEVYRFGVAMEDPNKAQGLADLAQEVVTEPKKEAEVVTTIMKIYRMSRPSAIAILRETKVGLKSTKLPWWKTMLGGSGNEVEGTTGS